MSKNGKNVKTLVPGEGVECNSGLHNMFIVKFPENYGKYFLPSALLFTGLVLAARAASR